MPRAASKLNAAGAKPAWLLIGRWVFLSTVPSGLLVAVTAHISTELTSAPLLWVMPLSLYLLTWVLVFQRKPALSHELVLSLQPFAVAGIVALLYLGHRVPMVPSLIGHLLAFFIIAMGCHGELARTRPAPAYLSSFYVSLSFGGMLGGLFAGLLAPYIFSWIAEYPILAGTGGALPPLDATATKRHLVLGCSARRRRFCHIRVFAGQRHGSNGAPARHGGALPRRAVNLVHARRAQVRGDRRAGADRRAYAAHRPDIDPEFFRRQYRLRHL